MWQMVGILAELERSLIQERTQAGRAAAKARGIKMGRKPLLSAQQIDHAHTLRHWFSLMGTAKFLGFVAKLG